PQELGSNNYKARPITVLGGGAPDLAVTSVVAQASAVAGELFTVRWAVVNQGSLPTESAGWNDTVYLSTSPALKRAGATHFQIGPSTHTGGLHPGQGSTQEQTIHLQPNVSGLHVIVKHGLPGSEDPVTSNNAKSAPTPVTTAPADLRITSVTAP